MEFYPKHKKSISHKFPENEKSSWIQNDGIFKNGVIIEIKYQ
jgi:hypothetical protein